jgi:two-component system alkaline phosphatase synthesis response regulator PhoP
MPGKIMIVDDEMHLARILQFTLEHAGYEVVTAFDGREALDSLDREDPDLVILDLMLPIVDGYKICNIMRKGEKYRDTPVIILSARDFSREELDEPLNADLLMEKPFNTEYLLEEIARLMG